MPFVLAAIKMPNLRFLVEIPLPFTNPLNGRQVLQVPAYGTMMMLGFLAAMLLVRRLTRRDNVNLETVHNVWFISLISGVLGARTFFMIQNGVPASHFFKIWEGGLVWYGGLFGALGMALVYIVTAKAPLAKIVDVSAPATMLGLAFGRVGCLLNGCCYGRVIVASPDGPWYGLVYPLDTPLGRQMFAKYGSLVTLHPAQVYSSLLALTICGLLLVLRRTRKVYGEQFLLMLVLYAPVRFLLEVIRTETPKEYWGFFTPGQIVGMLIFAPALAGWIALRLKGPRMEEYDLKLGAVPEDKPATKPHTRPSGDGGGRKKKGKNRG